MPLKFVKPLVSRNILDFLAPNFSHKTVGYFIQVTLFSKFTLLNEKRLWFTSWMFYCASIFMYVVRIFLLINLFFEVQFNLFTQLVSCDMWCFQLGFARCTYNLSRYSVVDFQIQFHQTGNVSAFRLLVLPVQVALQKTLKFKPRTSLNISL